jgi:hypothetical protein
VRGKSSNLQRFSNISRDSSNVGVCSVHPTLGRVHRASKLCNVMITDHWDSMSFLLVFLVKFFTVKCRIFFYPHRQPNFLKWVLRVVVILALTEFPHHKQTPEDLRLSMNLYVTSDLMPLNPHQHRSGQVISHSFVWKAFFGSHTQCIIRRNGISTNFGKAYSLAASPRVFCFQYFLWWRVKCFTFRNRRAAFIARYHFLRLVLRDVLCLARRLVVP